MGLVRNNISGYIYIYIYAYAYTYTYIYIKDISVLGRGLMDVALPMNQTLCVNHTFCFIRLAGLTPAIVLTNQNSYAGYERDDCQSWLDIATNSRNWSHHIWMIGKTNPAYSPDIYLCWKPVAFRTVLMWREFRQILKGVTLTHRGLVTPYDAIDLGHHWLR